MTGDDDDRDYEIFRQNLDLMVEIEGSPERLAVTADIPYHTILNWRQRGIRPSLASVEKLARAYKLSRDDLLDRQLKLRDFM